MKINVIKVSQKFFKLLKSLNAEDWNLKVNNNWRIKDVISHLIGWEKEAVKILDKEWKTKEKPWFLETSDFANFNQKSVETYKNYSPKELIKEWKKWQRLFDKKIKEIGEDNLRMDSSLFDWVFDDGEDNHYLVHLNQIKKVLQEK